MEITMLGFIYALKNIGAWLASYTIADVKADPQAVLFNFIIFSLISIPSDLYMLNHIQNKAKSEG